MAMLSSIVGSLAAHYSHLATNNFEKDLKKLRHAPPPIAISKIRTIGAMIYRYQRGLPYVFPKHELHAFCENFLHMMFHGTVQGLRDRAGSRQGPQPRAAAACRP